MTSAGSLRIGQRGLCHARARGDWGEVALILKAFDFDCDFLGHVFHEARNEAEKSETVT